MSTFAIASQRRRIGALVVAAIAHGCGSHATDLGEAVSSASAPNNLVPNPAFEAGGLSSWSSSGWSFSAVDHSDGSGSALFTGSGSTGSLASATFPISPNTQYNVKASFMTHQGGPTLQFKVVFYDSRGVGGDDVWAYSYTGGTANTWNDISGPVMSPWYAVTASFQVVLTNGSSAQVYLDDVDMRKAVIDDNDPLITYTPGVGPAMSPPGTWHADATEGYYQQTGHWVSYDASSNPRACHTFAGANRVGVGFRRQPNTGIMTITIDGVVTNTVNTNGSSFGLGFRWANPAGDLSLSASHTVCVQPAPGATIFFDYFELSSGPMNNVNDWLSTGGTIQDALAALDTFGTQGVSRTLYFPTGNYNISMHVRSDCYYSGGDIPSHVHLFGDGMDYSSIILTNDQPSSYVVRPGSDVVPPRSDCTSGGASVLQNKDTLGGDTDISVETLAIDGNSYNQNNGAHSTNDCDSGCSPGCTGYYAQAGLYFLRAANVWARMARFVNTKGTAACGVGEGFSTDFGLGNLAVYDHCEAVGGTQSASGFSVNQSTNTSYLGCRAFGYFHSNGFTHNGANIVRYTNCYAHGNSGYGYNSEVSFNVVYQGCVAGGNIPSVGGTGWPYPWAAGTYMPNNKGFVLNGDLGNGNLLMNNFARDNYCDLCAVNSTYNSTGNIFLTPCQSCP